MDPLMEVHANQGILEGQMISMGFETHSEITLSRFTSEIQKSFEIEGENLSCYSLRSSIARHLGLENIVLASGEQLDKPRQKIDAIVQVVTDAVHNCDTPLTVDRLFGWHEKLFPPNASGMGFNNLYKIRVAQFRTDEEGPMRVVSGNSLDPTVHFEAPPAERIPSEMDSFIEWFNQKNPPMNSVLKSALAHLYFVTLHPFEDGNGRLARAVADMALCRGDNFGRTDVPDSFAGMPHFENRLRTDHLFSMSAQLCKERKDYYRHLEETQNQDSTDVTDWLLWYVGCMNRAVLSVLSELKKSLFRKSFWEYADGFDLNVRQKKILALLLDDFKGKLTSSKYAKICKCSQDTAGRDMEKLVQANILRKGDAGGRSTEYMLVK